MSESGRAPWGAAIGGGIVGAVLTAAALALAGPSLFGGRMVREALLANPEMIIEASDALRAQSRVSPWESLTLQRKRLV